MLVLDDTRPRSLRIRIVHSRVALEIRLIKKFGLKADRTVLQSAKLKAKVCVNCTCVDHLLCHRVIRFLLRQIIHAKLHLNSIQHIRNHLRVTTHRNSLI